jgi:hypothetical protein
MTRKPSRAARPSEVVMDELAREQTPWDLDGRRISTLPSSAVGNRLARDIDPWDHRGWEKA